MSDYNFEYVRNQTVLMSDGSPKKMSDLKVGDFLMSNDSTPTKILNIETINELNYLVKPIKGTPFIIGESQSLAVNISGALQKYKNIENDKTKECKKKEYTYIRKPSGEHILKTNHMKKSQ